MTKLKNILKYLLIILLLMVLIYLSFVFLFNKKNKNLNINKVNDNNVIFQQDQNAVKNINIEQNATSTIKQSTTSAPILLNDEEKKKYGVITDKPVYLEMIEGNKDFPGPLPRLILPPELLASSSQKIDINADKKREK
ncbi:MAG: hypothetical protein Q7T79_03130 [bacterium]|nr:hypothetical protein [bacterium]